MLSRMNRLKGEPGKSLLNHIRTVKAVFLKNWHEARRYPINLLFEITTPIFWVLPYYFIIISFAPQGHSAGLKAYTGSSDFFSFYFGGMLLSYVLMSVFWGFGFTLKRLMDIGILETIWSAPISKVVYVLGESLVNLLFLGLRLIGIYFLSTLLFSFSLPASFTRVLPYFLPLAGLLYGFGLGFAALVLLVKDANTLVDTFSFFISNFSGTSYTPRVLPGVLLLISLAIPITYFLDLLRVETLGIIPLLKYEVEVILLFLSALLFPPLGILYFKRVENRCRREGSLHVH